jgi:hypothetical protein
MTDAPRTTQTERAYLQRYRQLRHAVETSLGPNVTITAFAAALIDTTRPTLSPASWRQYRASVCFGLETERTVQPELTREIDAAVTLLRATPPAEKRPDKLRTSQKKAKRLPEDDLERIQQFVLAGQSPNREALADYLLAADVTGLRPCEWPSARFHRTSYPGCQWELIVDNAKHTQGRAHGETRTLRFAELKREIATAIGNWLAVAYEADETGMYGKLTKSLSSLMRDCCAALFPRRERRPTMYTPRHKATARWKAFYIKPEATPEERELGRAVVAALLGHATDETATSHYARPRRDERTSKGLPVPMADPVEVARVRRLYARKLEQRAARRSQRSAPRPL